MKHDVFSLIIYVATACERSDPGRAYSCARSEIRWQNRIKYEKMLPFIYKYYILELQH